MMQKKEEIATNRSPAVFGRGDTGVRHVGRTGIECPQSLLEPIDLSETEESIRAKLGLKT